jgi:phospholipid transport system substrate-binding protein
MLLKGKEWFVYDVIIEGVSLVRNYRSQFKKIISKEKYAGLVKRVEEKVDNIASPEVAE